MCACLRTFTKPPFKRASHSHLNIALVTCLFVRFTHSDVSGQVLFALSSTKGSLFTAFDCLTRCTGCSWVLSGNGNKQDYRVDVLYCLVGKYCRGI